MMLASVVLPRPGRTENQHVIERLAAHARGLDEDVHLSLDVRLPDVVGEALRPHGAIHHLIVAPGGARYDPILLDAHGGLQVFAADLSARRMSSVVDRPGSSAAFNSRVTSGGL